MCALQKVRERERGFVCALEKVRGFVCALQK